MKEPIKNEAAPLIPEMEQEDGQASWKIVSGVLAVVVVVLLVVMGRGYQSVDEANQNIVTLRIARTQPFDIAQMYI